LRISKVYRDIKIKWENRILTKNYLSTIKLLRTNKNSFFIVYIFFKLAEIFFLWKINI